MLQSTVYRKTVNREDDRSEVEDTTMMSTCQLGKRKFFSQFEPRF